MAAKIDTIMPSRISMNVTIGKQSQGTTFGEKVNLGLQQAGSAIANGASLIGGSLPGAGIVSAAVSSVGKLSTMPGGSAASAGYAASGVITMGGGGGLSTTVGATGTTGVTTTGGTTASPSITNGASSNSVGMMNTELAQMTDQNNQMLAVQIALQRENQVFTSVSNALKTKHDTVKNSIGNIH
jgi:hypothetical protein